MRYDRREGHRPVGMRNDRSDHHSGEECESQGQKPVGPFRRSHDGPPQNVLVYYCRLRRPEVTVVTGDKRSQFALCPGSHPQLIRHARSVGSPKFEDM
jgi:hypothetical protein